MLIVQARVRQNELLREQTIYHNILVEKRVTPIFVNPLILDIAGKRASEGDFIDHLNHAYGDIPIILAGSGDAGFQEKPDTVGHELAMKYVHRTGRFIKKAYRENAYLLGICFGHQAMAYLLREPNTANNIVRKGKVGTYPVTITKEGKADYIFKDITRSDSVIQMVFGHSGQIVNPPAGFKVIGSVRGEGADSYSALSKNNIRTFQSHPELYSKQEATRTARLAGYNGQFTKPENTRKISHRCKNRVGTARDAG